MFHTVRIPLVLIAVTAFGVIGTTRKVRAQCEDPLPPNTKCWDGGGDGLLWSDPFNWNPDGVPQAQHNVYHLIGGSITYSVTDPFNETIASFTCNGGLGAGLVIDVDRTLTINGDMVRNAFPDAPYALTVKGQAEATVTGMIQDIDVTLDTGIPADETQLSAAGVVGGDWDIPKDTRVDISGNVDAQGATWRVGDKQQPSFQGGVLVIAGDTLGGDWNLFGDDVSADPLPEIRVNGTIEGGCWYLDATGCNPEAPQSRWTFYHVKEGPETCDPMVFFAGEVEMNPLPGAIIEGEHWMFDDTRPVGKVAQVIGGTWDVHKTSRFVEGEQTYVLHVGTFNPGDPSLGDVTIWMNNSDMILSGPESSSIASLEYKPGDAGCSGALQVSLETADDTTYTRELTFATLHLEGDDGARPHINRNSLGATSTNVFITQAATLINGEIRAKTLTVDNPEGGSSLLSIQSPQSFFGGSDIILAGPITFAGTPGGKSELVYSNRNNLIATQGEIIGEVAVDGFTLHTKARVRAEGAAPELHLEVAGSVDIRTDFMATWSGGPASGLVGQDWDWSTTDLTMTVMDPCSARVTLELISQDVGPIVFTDTPCTGALQDLILRTPGTGENCTTVDLVDNHLNRPPSGGPETLYVRNIVIESNRPLDVGVPFYMHYYGQLIINGTVLSNGVPLTGGPGDARDNPFIAACDTIYGDFDCDGEISSADIDAFCEVYTGSSPYGELFDSDCDGIVNGDQDDLDHFKLNLGDPEFQCP